MSDVQSRPSAPRGRGSSRSARGGYGSRGGGSTRGGFRSKSNGDQYDQSAELKYADEGEIGELKRKYSGQLASLKELFPDWTDEDIVFALQETDGDLESTIERITDGNVSQWGEVKKKSKERSRSKAQEPAHASATDQGTGSSGRGGSRAGRINPEGRGGRGRGTERGRKSGRGGRGGSVATTNGARSSGTNAHDTDDGKASIPTEESSAWEFSAASAPAQKVTDDDWGNFTTSEQTGDDGIGATGASTDHTAASEAKKSSIIPDGTKKSWASMFAKPAPPPVPKNIPPPPAAQPTTTQPAEPQEPETEALPPPPPSADITDTVADDSAEAVIPSEPDPTLSPPKDQLTETNLEQVLDTSIPPATATQVSTVASSRMTPVPTGSGTPHSSNSQLPAARPPTGGYGSSAFRATGAPGRSTSFQRRVLDQQEAVVMPSNPAVDRAAVQFGSLGLNGSGEEADVDEEREEAETRAQPPQHSPVAHPVTSLPPAPHQGLPPHQSPLKEAEPTPRQAPGLPVAPQSQQPIVPQQQTSTQPTLGGQSMAQQSSQGSHPYSQFNRYAQPGTQQDQPVPPQKSYDPFGQQPNQTMSNQTQFEGYTAHNATQQAQGQQQQHSHIGAFSSAPNDYSSYYTADPQQRGAYPNYYNAMYNQQSGQTPQDVGAGQQRTGSGIGNSATDPAQYPTSQAQQQAASVARYGQIADSHTSGQSTPNPVLAGPQQQQQHQQQQQQQQMPQQPQQQATQSQQSQHMQGQQPQTQAGGHNAYPYGHPYYSSPYYAAYMNQFGYGQSYGAPFGKQAGPYGQPTQGYGISPQTTYEHSSSPANVGGYGQASLHGRDSGLSGGLTDYGRTGSAQAAHGQQHSVGSGAFGGMPDVFGRYGSQVTQPLGQHPGNAQDDSLKGYGDSKTTTGGPSPSMNNHTGRTEHNNNNIVQGGQTGIAPPSQQSSNQPTGGSYGGYHLNPHHHLHTNQGGHYGATGTGAATAAGGLGGSGAGTGLTGGAAAAAAHHHLPGVGVGVGVGGGNQSHHHFNHQPGAAAATGYGSYPSTGGYGAGVGNYYATTGTGGGGRGAGAGAGVGGVGSGWGGYGTH